MSGLNYRNFVFALNNGKPARAQYALQAFSLSDQMLVGVHLRQVDNQPDLIEDAGARDAVLNRVFELELKGIAVRYTRLIVTGLKNTTEYDLVTHSIVADQQTGLPVRQQIGVSTSDVRAGEAWVSSINPRLVHIEIYGA